MDEQQTCPSRMSQCGPWEHKEGLDSWDTDRWCSDQAKVAAMHAADDQQRAEEYAEKFPGADSTIHRGPNSDLWLWPWGPPRTCSFCGGIHPEDAIQLMKEGWEVEATTKSYKRYLSPPGTSSRNQAFLASIKDHSREPGQGVPSVWSPLPPVKIYVDHFTEEQIKEFNAVLDSNKGT